MIANRAINALIGTDGSAADSFFPVKTQGQQPPELFGHSAVLDPAGRIVVFGGSLDSGHFSTDLWMLDLETRQWTSLPVGDQGPSGRSFHSCVVYNRALWVFGGSSNGIYHDLYRYNLDTGCWALQHTSGTHVPSPRYGHTAVVHGDTMYVYGGYDQMGFACNDLYELSLVTLCWDKPTTCGAVPKEVYHHSAVVFQGSMYTFGGYRKTYNEIQEYRFATKAWSFVHTTGTPPIPRWGHTAVVSDTNMYIFGGRDRVANFQDIHCFNFESRAWRRIECEGIEGRFFCAAVTQDAWMYVFGGRNIHSFAFNDTLRYGVREVRDDSLVEDLQQLVGNPEFADVVFVMPDDSSCGVEASNQQSSTSSSAVLVPTLAIPAEYVLCSRIYAHRNIVALRCPALGVMLSSSMQEGRTGVVLMRETTAPVVRGLLLYLYTDRVLLSSVQQLSGLLSLANLYQLAHLKHICQLRLIRCVTLHNAMELLLLSHQLEARLLFDSCRMTIAKNLPLIAKEQWEALPSSLAAAVQYPMSGSSTVEK